MNELLHWFRNHPVVIKYPIVKQMTKFGMVGALNTVVDFFIYVILTRVSFISLHYLVANFIAFSFAATSSFLLNRMWTFRSLHPHIHIQYVKFLLVALGGLALSESILFISVEYFSSHDVIGKLYAIMITWGWNFGMNKYWTFRDYERCHNSHSQS